MLERLGIAGGGAIACGLARLAAEHGDVVLAVRSDESAARVAESLSGATRVRIATDEAALADCTFVVEAIVEDEEHKCAHLAKLDEVLPADSILATTTSSLSISKLARASGRPDRFVGLHVFNPVEKMELVELALPPEATTLTRERARTLCQELDKTAVVVPDTPGFVVNALLFPFLFSAVRMLEDSGLTARDVDTCMTLGAGHRMGPLAVLDLVGLDVAIAIGEEIGADVPARLRALAAEGALGRKSGRGFHDYQNC